MTARTMAIDLLRSLTTHMEWADARIWSVVATSGDAGTDGRVRQLLYHIHVVQRAYLQVWRNEPLDVPPESAFADLAGVYRWARPCYGEARSFLARVDDDAAKATLAFPWAAEVAKKFGTAGPVSLGESILQVVMHSTYHRAQVATRIRELGIEPPSTDFVAWLWQERPAPDWEPVKGLA